MSRRIPPDTAPDGHLPTTHVHLLLERTSA